MTPWTGACQTPPPMRLFRQEYWSGLPFPSLGDLFTKEWNLGISYCRQTLSSDPPRKSKVKVAQSHLTLCDPMDYWVHEILQARILEGVTVVFFRGSCQPRDRMQVSPVAGRFFTSSVQFSSLTQSCPTLCNPTNRSTPGLPLHHQLPEFTQTHIHQISDAIQPSHPLSSPSPPAPSPSQNQSLFQWVNSSHEVAKVLEFQL